LIKLDAASRASLLDLSRISRLYLEGNILKVIDADGDPEFEKYLREATSQDKETRRKRLDVTKQIQEQNRELQQSQSQNSKLMSELQEALQKAEGARKTAEEDLTILQKRTQYQLMGSIVRVALWVIMGVGVTTTGMYLLALMKGLDTVLLGSTWSNMFSILLTNSFSIIGTIMGVKYASEEKE
jgi:hypothetical protein